jgi:hypothetical protein
MKSNKKRKSIPKDREAKILLSSRRRCALCLAYHTDTDIKKGQIAHIDRNPENNEEKNLAFLCLPHHDEYDGKMSQSKSWTPKELTESKNYLTEFIKNDFDKLLPESEISKPVKNARNKRNNKKEKRHIITLEVYNLRLPIYNAYRDLIVKIIRNANIDIQDLFEFSNKTHEALFLYDEKIDDHMKLIFQKGNRLQYLCKVVSNPRLADKEKWNSIVEEESDLFMWFHDDFEQTRKLFKQYLHLG